MLHPKIDGVWLRQIGRFAEVQYVETWPGGCESASWAMPEGTTHPALRPGASVEIFDGGVPRWKGTLDEPGSDGRFTAKGLHVLAREAQAIDSLSRPTRNVDWATADAWTRGALPGWQNPRTTSPRPVPEGSLFGSTDNSDLTVAQILDGWAAASGKRWGVNERGALVVAADPTVPSWEVHPNAVGGALTLEDDYATHLVGKYLDTTGQVSAVIHGDQTAADRWGRREVIVDLLPMGKISSATALSTIQGMFSLVGARMGFAEGLELASGQITREGIPAPLSMIRAGQMIRLHGVADLTRPFARKSYLDVVIGRVTYTDGAQTVQIAPVGMSPRNLADILKVEEATEDEGARAMAAEANTTATTANANATKALGLKPVQTTSTWTYSGTELPNDGILRTTHSAVFGIPATATLAVVAVNVPMVAAANAAGNRGIYVSNGSGGYHGTTLVMHNQSNPTTDIGAVGTYVTDAALHRTNGQSLQVVVNASNDPGSGAWTHVGPMHVTVTFLGY